MTIPKLPFRYIHLELTSDMARLVYHFHKWTISGYRHQVGRYRNEIAHVSSLREARIYLDQLEYIDVNTHITILDGGRCIDLRSDDDWVMAILGESLSN